MNTALLYPVTRGSLSDEWREVVSPREVTQLIIKYANKIILRQNE